MRKLISLFIMGLMIIPFFMVCCTKKDTFEAGNVLQIKDVGLREGVFVRRYKLTSDYGRQQEFTP